MNDDKQSLAKGITGTGQIMGTLDYMAPEQTSDTHTVDIRADIYSLGCTLYALLAGQPPFAGEAYTNAYQKIVAHNQHSPRPLHEIRQNVPPAVVAILNKMLAKNPADRYTSPIEVAAALAPYCDGNTLLSTLVEAEARLAEHKSRSDAATQELNSSAMQGTATGAADEGGYSVAADDELLELLRSTAVDETIVTKQMGKVPETQFQLNVAATPTVKQVRQTRAQDSNRLRIQVMTAVACAVLAIIITAVVLRIKSNYGTIELTLYHKDAQVTVDGATVRLRPGTGDDEYLIRIAPGQRKLQVEKDGYITFTRDIEIAKGETKIVAITLLRDDPNVASTLRRAERSSAGVAPGVTLDSSSNVAPLGSSRRSVTATLEPPPLDQWLEGREILTVKQDGSAMFTKIQDALDALKAGQVVEVLDEGPYRETLNKVLPQDTGLITRVGSHVALDEWREFPNSPSQKYQGHTLAGKLRLSGFVFSARQQHDAVLLTLDTGDFTIEGCVFRNVSRLNESELRSLTCGTGHTRKNVIRDCVFGGQVYLGFHGEGSSALVLRNHFRAFTPALGAGCFNGLGDTHTLVIRQNVFDESTFRAIQLGVVDGWFNLRGVVEQNTILSRNEIMIVGHGIPEVPLIVRDNLIASAQGIFLTNGAENSRTLAEERIVRTGNCYFQAPTHPDGLAISASDILAQPTILSRDPSAADYARLQQDDANPIWAGAFAPGPAPLQGDWFTRLQERWKVAITLRRDEPGTPPAVPGTTPDNSSNSTPPGSSRRSVTATLEPPPLDQWLEGREILTVKQDGSAMFTKIQDALDALKPGQVVEVLDKGPYLTPLSLVKGPADVGLVSRVATVIGSPETILDQPEQMVIALQDTDRFRLEGLNIIGSTTRGTLIRLLRSPGSIIQNCVLRDIRNTEDGPAGYGIQILQGGGRVNSLQQSSLIRHCWLECGVSVGDENVVLAENVVRRSWVASGNGHQIGFGGGAVIHMAGNIVDCSVSDGINFRQLSEVAKLELVNNTFYGTRGAGNCIVQEYVPIRGATIVGNVVRAVELQLRQPPALNWDLRGNCVALDSTTPSTKLLHFPSATNLIVEPQIMSTDPNSRDYMRPSTDSPLAGAGLGGDYPTYIGALPAGPVPAEGDWLLRLQQRWQEATQPPPASHADEPLPLDQWLQGREILTVKQDGTAMFTKIQDALDAAKSGQVVEILDRGPYRENLRRFELDDLGVVSRVGSVIVPSEYKQVDYNGTPMMVVHQLSSAAGLRLHGLQFEFDHANSVRGLHIRCPGAVVEQCAFRFAGRLQPEVASYVAIESAEEDTWTVPAIVRDCEFLNGGVHAYSYQKSPLTASVIVYRNYFAGDFIDTSYCVYVNPNWQTIWIRENVFAADHPISVLRLSGKNPPTKRKVYVANNTFLNAGQAILAAYAPPFDGMTLENNLFATAAFFFQTPEMRTKAITSWQLRNNWFVQPRSLPEDDIRNPGVSNLTGPLNFLSTDANHRDFLRLAPTSPAATGGAGGDLPTYIGAIPPGPAPPEGDWFTRLQERWKAAQEDLK